jgi:dephospho-CoA kinase
MPRPGVRAPAVTLRSCPGVVRPISPAARLRRTDGGAARRAVPVLSAGLGGGIGAGKSAVCERLAAHGAVVVDADVASRRVVEPGASAYGDLVARFGTGILHEDGTVERPALARVVFADPGARADLEAITHPRIAEWMLAERDRLAGPTDIVVFALPLLVREHLATYRLDLVVMVDAPVEVATDRLVSQRRMAPEDAAARIAAQMSREERAALADYVLDNSGSEADLDERVDELWLWLRAKARGAE